MRLLLVLALFALVGCFGSSSKPVVVPCPLGGANVVGLPFDVAAPSGTKTDPLQPWDALVYSAGTVAGGLSVQTSPGWSWSSVRMSNATGPHLERVRVQGSAGTGASAAVLGWTAGTSDLCPAKSGLRAKLETPVAGALAKVGKAVQVYTAGFWENGTLFYTNIESVDASAWPRAGWYAWEGGDPLPVYVYDQARTEQGPQWNACPPANAVATQCGWSYFTTIEGFNEALKGLSTTTSRVVWMPPEKAYTKAGNEAHPLYGDALIFYIEIVRVDDAPCPPGVPPLACDLPG